MQINITLKIVGPVLPALNKQLADTWQISISNPENMEIRVSGTNNSIIDDDGFTDTVMLSDLPQLLSDYAQGIQSGVDPRYWIRGDGKRTPHPRQGDPMVALAALYSGKFTESEVERLADDDGSDSAGDETAHYRCTD